jgi:hypothetical protein
MGKPNLLSAYLRYFLPWNVYRLCRLLPSLPLDIKDGDAIIDLGSGPLTFVLALWLCCPALRPLPLAFLCVDRNPSALNAGEKIFSALTLGVKNTWKIRTLRGELAGRGIRLSRNHENGLFHPEKTTHGKPVALVSAINVFNEIYGESPADKGGLKNRAEKSGHLLSSCCGKGAVLVLEPGIPSSGEFISSLRASLLEQGLEPVSPCVHKHACPFPGGLDPNKGKAKWCHFSFDTDDAPLELHRLSTAAGIPKERAVLSFLLAKKNTKPIEKPLPKKELFCKTRVISDPFPVGTLYGCYGCSDRGLVLARGARVELEALDSGTYIDLKITEKRDSKSGALIGELL